MKKDQFMFQAIPCGWGGGGRGGGVEVINVRNQFLFRFNVGNVIIQIDIFRNNKRDEEKYTVDNQGFFLSFFFG